MPHKAAIFGVNCEGLRRQANYVTDEAVHVGKVANAVISQLHHFFALENVMLTYTAIIVPVRIKIIFLWLVPLLEGCTRASPFNLG